MKRLFDTSVFIAAFVESHPFHNYALPFLIKAKNAEFELFVSAHSLLEIYSVLTSAPFHPKISPTLAKRLIETNIKSIAKIVSLSDDDYFKILTKMSKLGLSGGIVYDAIIVHCAQKAGVDEIITLNQKDFVILTESTSIKVRSF